ncbi:glycosyltransferase family 4 protein [Sphingomonas arenae]|uniref:glycosyltransferase family 4 protein n=1 Tax=Sphingomonas arenae TaxID=2812555 RepID=UPI001966FD00|nr:glycosyltransferase family 4 protein [Sphingomonas arenae]
MSRRILVLCPYPLNTGAGQRLKFEQYYGDWRAVGYEVTVSPFMDMALWEVAYRPGHLAAKAWGTLKGFARRVRDLTRVGRYDLVYVFMWVTPVGGSLFERWTRALAKRLVFDVEDNVVLGEQERGAADPNPLLRWLRGTGKARLLVERADHVVTSSPALNAKCLALNRAGACAYISSSVDTDRFVPAVARSEGPVTIGWTGTFSSRGYLDLLRPVFQDLARERTFRLRVIGNFDYELPGVDLDVVRWTAEREVEDLQALDIGVYPLTDDDWVTGKSGLKAIQYMAFGIPCVATAVGTTPDIIRDGENGLLVRSIDEWLLALRRLIDEPDLRRRLGEQAREDAVARYSLHAIAGDYRRVLADTLAKD